MPDNNQDRPATKADVTQAIDNAITRMERPRLKREIDMFWKFLLLSLSLLGVQWAAISWMMAHWKAQ